MQLKAQLEDDRMDQRRLFFDTSRCNGCGLCQLVCAAVRSRQWQPELSRIRILGDANGKAYYAISCSHCDEAPCVMACLMNTIFKEKDSGLTTRDLEQCIGCRACELACPFDAAIFDETQEKVVNCDLCQGRPLCVEYCPNGALAYTTLQEQADKMRFQGAALKLKPLMLEGYTQTGEEENPCG